MTRKSALVRKSPAVLVEGSDLYTTSQIIADRFEMRHDNVLQAIANLNSGEDFNRLNFQAVTYTDAKGEDRKMYRVSEEGFMRIAFRFNSKRLGPMQDWFCTEFFRMRRYLQRVEKKKTVPEWQISRKEITDGRRIMTDTVKAFVEYAKAQGSKHASTYYMNLTKAEHKALFIVEHETGVPLRDRLTTAQMGTLRVAEQIADRALREGMDAGLHYKEIYVIARERIEQYASLVGRTRIDDQYDPPSLNA